MAPENKRSRRTDAYSPDDFVTPFSDGSAECASPIDLHAPRHRLPRHTRTIVGNDSIANHPDKPSNFYDSINLAAKASGFLITQIVCPIVRRAGRQREFQRWEQYI
jgi:hypothetical protein